MSLQGASGLRRRLKAIREVFKPIGRQWADEAVLIARSSVPVRTGRTQRSIRRRSAGLRRASIVATFGARYIEKGTKAHSIEAKDGALRFTSGSGVHFAKKVNKPATPARPFLIPAGKRALDRMDFLKELIRLWNEAA